MTLAQFLSVMGLVFGVTGTVLGVLNYLRDRARVVVHLQWDMSVTPAEPGEANRLWGFVRVTNIGRRPAYVSHAALRVPEGSRYTYLVLTDAIAGTKLLEGDPPKTYVVKQDGLEKYADRWQEVVAQISDSTGRVWRSPRLEANSVPSWARHGRATDRGDRASAPAGSESEA